MEIVGQLRSNIFQRLTGCKEGAGQDNNICGRGCSLNRLASPAQSLKRRHVGYRELAEKLTAMGIPETERNIANKISRGGFTAAFLIQCLKAIGCTVLRLEES